MKGLLSMLWCSGDGGGRGAQPQADAAGADHPQAEGAGQGAADSGAAGGRQRGCWGSRSCCLKVCTVRASKGKGHGLQRGVCVCACARALFFLLFPLFLHPMGMQT